MHRLIYILDFKLDLHHHLLQPWWQPDLQLEFSLSGSPPITLGCYQIDGKLCWM